VQQLRADSGTEFVTAAMAAAGCSMQFVLPNRTPLPATREAGLVQIALPRFQTYVGQSMHWVVSRLTKLGRQIWIPTPEFCGTDR